MTPKPKAMRLNVDVQGGTRIKPISEKTALDVPFDAVFSNEDLTITLTIDVENNKPVCRRYAVDGDDLLMRTTDVIRGYNIRWLATEACALMAFERLAPGEGGRGGLTVDTGDAIYSSRASLAAIEDVVGPIRRRREPITDGRLREFAEAFQRDYRKGGQIEFAESLGMSERQMWRLVTLARKRGFLPKKGDAK